MASATSGWAQLPRLDESRDPIADGTEVLDRTRPVAGAAGQRRGPGRVGGRRRHDVDPVQGVQVVEVHDVVVDHLHGGHNVANSAGVGRNRDAQGVLHRSHRREGVDGRADTARPLGEHPGVARITFAQDQLEAAEHRSRAPGVADRASFHLDLDPEVSFDAGHRVDGDPGHWSTLFEGWPSECSLDRPPGPVMTAPLPPAPRRGPSPAGAGAGSPPR